MNWSWFAGIERREKGFRGKGKKVGGSSAAAERDVGEKSIPSPQFLPPRRVLLSRGCSLYNFLMCDGSYGYVGSRLH